MKKEYARVKKFQNQMNDLRTQTLSQLGVIKYQIIMVEQKLNTFESTVSTKERQIRETYQTYKSSMYKDIQVKVRKQLEGREEDYYNLMRKLQDRMKLISSTSGADGGFLADLYHQGISLFLSGAAK